MNELIEKEDDLTRAVELVREAAELSRSHMGEAADELCWIAELMENEASMTRGEIGVRPA